MPIDRIGRSADTGMEPKARAGQPAEEENLRKACTDFEALFINQILRAMRQTLPKGGLLKEGPERDIFQSLFDQELSRSIAGRKGLGLGEMIYRKMSVRGTAQPPAGSEGSLPGAGKDQEE